MRRIGAVLLCLTGAWAYIAGPARAGDVEFNRDVRPILSESCFDCHGPDKNKRKADLRLDTREGLFRESDDVKVVSPGQPEESDLLERITSDDAELRMPPPKSGRSLTESQVATIRRWIEQGAEWQGHWAYLKPTRPPVPAVEGAAFIKNDIDRFVLATIRTKGMAPSPEADRVTLIRRLSFDLTGLPPSPREVEAFVNDAHPDAYERLVDRLLNSPHFGERMASYWLDLVRYADTGGYHSDNHRDVWPYRDYVIDAFNANMPFDRFTTEQLAGDLLPDPTDAQRVASGYNRLLQTTEEGGAQAKEYTAKYAADRVRNASSVWLGSTLGCAECHDHKYDPFKTKDFYRFAAFFADVQEKAVGRQDQTRIPSPEQATRVAELDARMAPLRTILDTQTPELEAAQAAWERSLRERRSPEWAPLKPIAVASKSGAQLQVLADGTVIFAGPNPDKDTYTLTFKTDGKAMTAIRLDLLPDDSLPARGPGRAPNGNFVLNEIEMTADGRPVRWSAASATHSQEHFPVAAASDGNPETGWAILPQSGRAHHAVFEAESDLGGGGGETTLTIALHQDHGDHHTLGRFRLSATDAPRPVRAESDDGIPKKIREILASDPEKRGDAQRDELAAYYRGIAPALEPTRKAMADLQARKKQVEDAMPQSLVTTSGTPRMVRVLPRGNWLDDSGEVVSPGTPEFLPALGVSDRRPTRLDLARWLTSEENPLVARVFVNRLWKIAFGQGLVATLEDFGSQGASPTHPELLDWLAVEFRESGWDVKHTLRLLMTSGTYRQTSRADESLRQRDPANAWLARQGRFRLDAEMVRDNALAVSGLLAREVGGPSARPYQPAGYWALLNFPKREYQPDHGDGLYRRGLYTYWCRTFLHPSLLAFDAPTREECTVERPRSNTPVQALVLLNDPIYVEAARVLAERMVREGGPDPDSRIDFAFRRATSRPARPTEVAALKALQHHHIEKYRADVKAAEEAVRVGEWPVPADIDPAELAAWTSVARVVLNLHETLTRN